MLQLLRNIVDVDFQWYWLLLLFQVKRKGEMHPRIGHEDPQV